MNVDFLTLKSAAFPDIEIPAIPLRRSKYLFINHIARRNVDFDNRESTSGRQIGTQPADVKNTNTKYYFKQGEESKNNHNYSQNHFFS